MRPQRLPVGHALAIFGAGLVATLHLLWGFGAGIHAVPAARWLLILTAVGGAALVLTAGMHIPWPSRWAGQILLWVPFVATYSASGLGGTGIAYAVTAATATAGDLTTIRFRRKIHAHMMRP